MAANEVHAGVVGFKFEVDVTSDGTAAQDLSSANPVVILFQKPDGSMFTPAASFVTNGSDGKVYYRTVSASDFDQTGTWRYQVQADFGTNVFYSDVNKFKVFPNLPLGV